MKVGFSFVSVAIFFHLWGNISRQISFRFYTPLQAAAA